MKLYNEIRIDKKSSIKLKSAINKTQYKQIWGVVKRMVRECEPMQKALKEIKNRYKLEVAQDIAKGLYIKSDKAKVMTRMWRTVFELSTFMCLSQEMIANYDIDDKMWDMLDVGYQLFKKEYVEKGKVA